MINLDLNGCHLGPECLLKKVVSSIAADLAHLDRAALAFEIDEEGPLDVGLCFDRFYPVGYGRTSRFLAGLRSALKDANEEKRFAHLIFRVSDELTKNIAEAFYSADQIFELLKERQVDKSDSEGLDHARDLAHAFLRSMALLHTVSLILNRSYEPSSYKLTRWCLRVLAIDLAIDTQDIPPFSHSLWHNEAYRQAHALRKLALDLFSYALLLEARVSGDIPAFEGTFIVKERRM